MQSEDLRVIKVVIIGDACTGKSSLLLRAVDDMFSESYIATIGVDFKIRSDENNHLKLQIWDTAGQERFRTITSSYYKGASVFVVVFDVTKRATFDNVSTWLEQIKTYSDPAKNHPILLVGNKADLPNREVSLAEAEDFAQTHHMMYLDFSSKTGKSDEAFQKFAEAALKSLL